MKILKIKHLFIVEDSWLCALDEDYNLHIQLSHFEWHDRESFEQGEFDKRTSAETINTIKKLYNTDWKKQYKTKESNWDDLTVMINGTPIPAGKVQTIKYTGTGKIEGLISVSQAEEEIIMRSTLSEKLKVSPKIIDITHETTETGTVQHIKLGGKIDMLTVLKRIGIELQFGKGELPVSYKNTGDFEIKGDTLRFITTITKKEWDEAPE